MSRSLTAMRSALCSFSLMRRGAEVKGEEDESEAKILHTTGGLLSFLECRKVLLLENETEILP